MTLHDSVQVPTSQPSGMISKLPEPRKQCHGCDLCVWHASQWPGVFITFLRENLWRKIHALWVRVHSCLNCSCNYGWQTCSWVKQDFIQWTSTHDSCIWAIATCNQMMSFDFVIQLTPRLAGPRSVLCHPDQHGAMLLPLRDISHFAKEQCRIFTGMDLSTV